MPESGASGGRERRRVFIALAAMLILGGSAIAVGFVVGHRSERRLSAASSPRSTPPIAEAATWLPAPHDAVEAIWPQQTKKEAGAAQAKADAGDPAFTWEADAAKVAKRFVTQQLGWPQAFATHQFQGKGVDRLVYDVSTCEPSGCLIAGFRDNARVLVTMDRLGKEEGDLWMITAVDDPSLALNVQPGTPVPNGAPIIGFTMADAGTDYTAGYAFAGPCGMEVGTVDGTLAAAEVDFVADLAGVPAPCTAGGEPLLPVSGYVFLMTPGGLGGTPFMERTGGNARIHFLAVPVTFQPGTHSPQGISTYLSFPASPDPVLDKRRREVLHIHTSLPAGTRVSYYVESKDLETPGFEIIQGDPFDLAIANNDCREVDGVLVGTKVTVTLEVAPVYPWPGSCGGSPGFAGCAGIPQTPAILALLGRHFERAAGPQVEINDRDQLMVVRHRYQFPASTCIPNPGL